MNLHLLSRSPFMTTTPFLQALNTNDIIILMADACYYLQNLTLLHQCLENHNHDNIKILVLTDDCALRGLNQQLARANGIVKACNSDQFARLTLTAEHILNW